MLSRELSNEPEEAAQLLTHEDFSLRHNNLVPVEELFFFKLRLTDMRTEE